ncbi:hypothetical protein ACNOYE_05455 [Nannocystaceae bacterium ST9]
MSSRIDTRIVRLFDPNWKPSMIGARRSVHLGDTALADTAEVIASQPRIDPLLSLARHRQLEALRSSGCRTLDCGWAREVAREVARMSECDWHRGPALAVRLHEPGGSVVWTRLLRITSDRVWLSPQAGLELGVRVVIERDDPVSDTHIEIAGHCSESTRESIIVCTDGHSTIVRPAIAICDHRFE